MKSRIFARELCLLFLPVLFLAVLGGYFMRRPAPKPPAPPGVWHLRGSIKRVKVWPYQVRQGLDTAVDVECQLVSPQGMVGVGKQGGWWSDIRLVERDKQGRERRLWQSNRQWDTPELRRVMRQVPKGFGGYGTGGLNQWFWHYNFPARLLGKPSNALELRADWVWCPFGTEFEEATPSQIVQRRKLPGSHFLSQRLVLRKIGETTPLPVVSTQPRFDIRRVELLRARSGMSHSNTALKVQWHLFWKGDIPNYGSEFPCMKSLVIVDEKGREIEHDDNTPVSVLHPKSRRFEVWCDWETKWWQAQTRRFGSKKLWMRGWISAGGEWPRSVDIPLPSWVLKEDGMR